MASTGSEIDQLDIISKTLVQGIQRGQIVGKTKSALDWYKAKCMTVGRADPKEVLKETSRQIGNIQGKNLGQTNIMPGNMYLYKYDPIHKAILPYWDMYPLVFPFSMKGGYMTGINLHYLDARFRAMLMDQLLDTKSDDRYDEKTKLKISYNILKRSAANWYMAPTIHMYKLDHIKGTPVFIYPVEWVVAAFLPFQRFQKAQASKVWRDSISKLSEFEESK